MKYEIAKKENIEQIYQLVQNTINAIYPLYYPQGVVEFFCGLHSKENIATDIENGFVRVLLSGDCLVGTGSCKENHISRLFVASDFQKMRNAHCRTWIMAKKLKIMENEKYPI